MLSRYEWNTINDVTYCLVGYLCRWIFIPNTCVIQEFVLCYAYLFFICTEIFIYNAFEIISIAYAYTDILFFSPVRYGTTAFGELLKQKQRRDGSLIWVRISTDEDIQRLQDDDVIYIRDLRREQE